MDYVDELAKCDPRYQKMLAECRILERQLFHVLETIPPEVNEIVWDFIMLCESMSERKLWLACNEMKKPSD